MATIPAGKQDSIVLNGAGDNQRTTISALFRLCPNVDMRLLGWDRGRRKSKDEETKKGRKNATRSKPSHMWLHDMYDDHEARKRTDRTGTTITQA